MHCAPIPSGIKCRYDSELSAHSYPKCCLLFSCICTKKTRFFSRNNKLTRACKCRQMAMPGLDNPFEWHDDTEALDMLMNGVRFCPGLRRQMSDVERYVSFHAMHTQIHGPKHELSLETALMLCHVYASAVHPDELFQMHRWHLHLR